MAATGLPTPPRVSVAEVAFVEVHSKVLGDWLGDPHSNTAGPALTVNRTTVGGAGATVVVVVGAAVVVGGSVVGTVGDVLGVGAWVDATTMTAGAGVPDGGLGARGIVVEPWG